jgi:hypothetical protein
MVPPFDIFRLDAEGKLRWLQTADSLQGAKLRIEVLALSDPGRYVIFSQKTGNKTVIDAGKAQDR